MHYKFPHVNTNLVGLHHDKITLLDFFYRNGENVCRRDATFIHNLFSILISDSTIDSRITQLFEQFGGFDRLASAADIYAVGATAAESGHDLSDRCLGFISDTWYATRGACSPVAARAMLRLARRCSCCSVSGGPNIWREEDDSAVASALMLLLQRKKNKPRCKKTQLNLK